VRANSQSRDGGHSDVLEGKEIVLRVGRKRRLDVNGRTIRLRRAEIALVRALAREPLPADRLLLRALGTHGDGGATRFHICEIRRKLRAADLPDFILTSRGSGYALRPDCVVLDDGALALDRNHAAG
jgi:DNA-binding response OmpR family regulator